MVATKKKTANKKTTNEGFKYETLEFAQFEDLGSSRKGFYIAPVLAGRGSCGLDIAELAVTANRPRDVQEKYARLFTAAPELLGICEKVLADFSDSKAKFMPRPMGQDELIPVLQAAIAKAKGGAS